MKNDFETQNFEIFDKVVHNFGKSLFCEKMLISNMCIGGLMSNLIKKSWTVSKLVLDISSLDVEDNDAIVDGKFQLQCKTGGVFEDSLAISWPTCIVENCTQLLTQDGYVGNETELPVAVGSKIGYRQGIHYI